MTKEPFEIKDTFLNSTLNSLISEHKEYQYKRIQQSIDENSIYVLTLTNDGFVEDLGGDTITIFYFDTLSDSKKHIKKVAKAYYEFLKDNIDFLVALIKSNESNLVAVSYDSEYKAEFKNLIKTISEAKEIEIIDVNNVRIINVTE